MEYGNLPVLLVLLHARTETNAFVDQTLNPGGLANNEHLPELIHFYNYNLKYELSQHNLNTILERATRQPISIN